MKGFLGTLRGLGRPRQGEALGTHQHSIRFRVLRRATNKFANQNLIGIGGFGEVYLGVLKDGTRVAVKRNKKGSRQGDKEFQAEMEVLLRLKHPNLVSLIGYCKEKEELILVYEYMEKGSLKSHLYGHGKPLLSWKQRLEICVGAAKGLHHLHTSSSKGIIHRDVKSDNILLDGNLFAKISDFGLSRDGPDAEQNQTHVSTRAMGTFGYVDPQYSLSGKLTMKSDVYSFGVVLLEVISGRRVNSMVEGMDFVNWGKNKLEEGEGRQIVDEKILDTIHPHNLVMFGGIVLRCLADRREQRPTMEEVLRDLEWELNCVRDEEKVAAVGNSDDDESDDAISSQLILQRGGRALQRSVGGRYSSVYRHAGFDAPSTSLGGVWLESIFEDENSSDYDSESD